MDKPCQKKGEVCNFLAKKKSKTGQKCGKKFHLRKKNGANIWTFLSRKKFLAKTRQLLGEKNKKIEKKTASFVKVENRGKKRLHSPPCIV